MNSMNRSEPMPLQEACLRLDAAFLGLAAAVAESFKATRSAADLRSRQRRVITEADRVHASIYSGDA